MHHQPKLILSIEDDQDDIALIEETALEFDPSLRFVAKGNGKEAMMFLFRQKEENYLPCLILLDFNMPVMNGKEVLNILKTDDRFKTIPVIVFTTSSGEREHLICEAYDVQMITKPNRVKEFKKVLKDLLGQCISQH